MTPRREDGLDAVREADVVVVGAGAAGLSAALGLAGRRVDLLSKGPLAQTGSSPWAQGGVAAAVGDGDTPALHAADTLAAAGAVGDPRAVAWLTAEGPARLAELVALGARFDRDAAGRLHLAREAAHSRRRILHARDATGAEIVRTLRSALARTSGLSVFERAFCLELATDGPRVAGVLARHADGAVVLHRARAVVLATGGIGRAYARTTNPAEATGDGLALAWRAGARLADLEFVQFHPTALDVGEDPLPLLTEALRGAGARLVDEDGRFLLADGDLQPRDVVARALWRALASGRRTLLDARAAVGQSFPERFPTVFEACRAHGLDPRREPMPVAPAAHYHMGGVLTDLDGRTSRPGLWAAGEVACTGVHGANRLASNSLLEALVFGAAVARSVGETLRRAPAPPRRSDATLGASAAPTAPPADGGAAGETSAETAARVASVVRRTMWERVGLVRDARGLEEALRAFAELDTELPAPARAPLSVLETRNLLSVARLVATAALARTESRGAHFRADHPAADAAWRCRQVVTRNGDGVRISVEPVAGPAATRGVSA
jgi:L-aspartate oxidase